MTKDDGLGIFLGVGAIFALLALPAAIGVEPLVSLGIMGTGVGLFALMAKGGA